MRYINRLFTYLLTYSGGVIILKPRWPGKFSSLLLAPDIARPDKMYYEW